METEDDDMAGYAALASFSSAPHPNSIQPPPLSPTPTINHAIIPPPPMSPLSALRRRRFSFLQHLAVDDVLLRIFEFIDCASLVKTGTTCHRFRELSNRSAEQRTQRLADGRLLRSAMKMLRAQEQIDGVGPREEAGPFVPIPMLGLPRRIKVSGAGDPEYNGIYFCTGSNGNGFLFTKPRNPERRVRMPPTFNIQHLVELDGGGDAADDANNDNVAGVGMLAPAGNNVNNAGLVNGHRQDAVDILYGDEPNRSRLLRCVIAKRFSNEVSC